MKKSTFFAVVVAVFVLLMTVQVFAGGNRERADGNIKIAVAVPLTGNNAEYGRSFLTAAEIMADKWNAAGGVLGRQVTIVSYDDRNSADEAASIAERIVSDKDIHFVMGHFASGVSMAAGPTYQENQVIMISPTSTHPDYTSIGDYVFRTCTIITDEFRFAMDILANDLQARNVAVVAIKTDWGNTAGNIAVDLIRNDPRLNLVIHEEVMETSNDYGPEIAKIRASGADTVYMIGMYSFYAPFVRQFREVDPSIKLAAVANAYTRQIIELGGVAATEGIIMPVSFYSESDNPIIREFVDEFKKRFGMEPSSMAAQAYDAVGIMLQATKDAGTLNRARLRDAVQKISYPGATGIITFNEYGDAYKIFEKVIIRNGRFVPFR